MNTQEVIFKIEQNDLDFVVRLIIDNNPTAVKDNLVQEGLATDLPSNYSNMDLYNKVIQVINEGKGDQAYRILSVPYSEGSQQAYTTGLSDYIEAKERESVSYKGDFMNTWGPVIGTVLTIGGGLLLGSAQTDAPSGTPSEPQATDVTTKTDEDKILGLNPPLFWGALILITALSLVLILKKKRG